MRTACARHKQKGSAPSRPLSRFSSNSVQFCRFPSFPVVSCRFPSNLVQGRNARAVGPSIPCDIAIRHHDTTSHCDIMVGIRTSHTGLQYTNLPPPCVAYALRSLHSLCPRLHAPLRFFLPLSIPEHDPVRLVSRDACYQKPSSSPFFPLYLFSLITHRCAL